MIDHEYYLLHILLSKSTYFVLLQDMHRFNIYQDVKGEKKINMNRFVNKTLPTIIGYRKEKDEKFEKTILNKYSSFMKYTDKEATTQLLFLANENYYSDDSLDYHNEKISLRISKNNMKLMDTVFEDLSDFSIKKSKFVRSLLNQYSDMKTDIREFMCFNNEYHLFEKAIIKNSMIKYTIKGISEEAYPITINTCPYDSEIYLFTLKRISNDKLELKTIRLCEIENIKLIDNVLEIDNKKKVNEIIKDYVVELKYYDNRITIIGG